MEAKKLWDGVGAEHGCYLRGTRDGYIRERDIMLRGRREYKKRIEIEEMIRRVVKCQEGSKDSEQCARE